MLLLVMLLLVGDVVVGDVVVITHSMTYIKSVKQIAYVEVVAVK
jgi:dTDP-4-amino-4,6-dideoxygalactose transaminase